MATLLLAEHDYSPGFVRSFTRFMLQLKDWPSLGNDYSKTFRPLGSPSMNKFNSARSNLVFSATKFNDFFPGIIIKINFANPKFIKSRAVELIISIVDEYERTLFDRREVWQGSVPGQLCLIFANQAFYSTYTRNDELTFDCEIRVADDITKFPDNPYNTIKDTYKTYIRKKFDQMTSRLKSCDVALVSEERRIYAHKAILAANSEVFNTMFDRKGKKRQECIVYTDDIDDGKFTAFEAFLKYMYTGQADEMSDLIKDLLFLADKYGAMGLRDLCEQFVLKNLNCDNASKYHTIALLLCMENLAKATEAMIP